MQSEETNGDWNDSKVKALTARERAVQEYEATQIEKGLMEAFTRAGGRQPAKWDSPDEISPLVAIQEMLKDKIIFTSGGLILKGETHPNGNVKTLDDKLKELKTTQISGYLFNSSEPQQQKTQQQPTKPTFTREQARNGKADIDAIARNKADVV